MQHIESNADLARRALGLMEEALGLLDVAGEHLAACHLAGAIDDLDHLRAKRDLIDGPAPARGA